MITKKIDTEQKQQGYLKNREVPDLSVQQERVEREREE